MAKRRKRLGILPEKPAVTPAPESTHATNLRWHLLAALGIGLVAAVFFGGSVHYPLVFDDANFFAADVLHRNSRQPVWAARWLSTVSFLIPSWSGPLPSIAGWRMTNIGLHAINGVLIYALVWMLASLRTSAGGPLQGVAVRHGAALLAALAFVMHPISAYAVTYLVQRSIVLATLFSLLAMICTVRWAGAPQRGWLAGAAFCAVCAISAKPHAAPVFWALLSLAWLLAPERVHFRSVLVLLALVMVAAFWLLAPHFALMFGANEPYVESMRVEHASHPYLVSVLTQCLLYFRYLLLMAVPWPGWMSVDVRVSMIGPRWEAALAPAAFLLALAGVLFLMARSRRFPLRLAGWALGACAAYYAVELSTARIQEPFVLYRAYLWLAPCMVAAGVSLAHLSWWRAAALAALVWLGFSGWALTDRQATFADADKLWTDAIIKLPKPPPFMSQRAYANRGLALMESGAYARALDDFDRALQIAPNHYEALVNRASVRARLGDKATAVRDLEQAASLRPELPYPYGPLCEVYSGMRNLAAAERACTRAIGFLPRAEFYINRGTVRGTGGDRVRALSDFEQAVAMEPANPLALYNRSQALGELGQHASALEGFQLACSLGYAPACLPTQAR